MGPFYGHSGLILTREKLLGQDHLAVAGTLATLSNLLCSQGKPAEAEPLLISDYEGMEQRRDKMPAVGKVRVKEALTRLVRLYELSDRTAQAAEWRRKMADLKNAHPVASSVGQTP